MKLVWRIMGRILGYLTWPMVYLVIKFTSRTKVLVICNNEILIVQPWLGTGSWSCAGGGLGRGEDPSIGAAREIKEELGIMVKNTDLQSLGLMQQTRGFRNCFHAFYLTLPAKPELHVRGLEIVGATWVNVQEIEKLSTQQHVKLLLDAWQKQR